MNEKNDTMVVAPSQEAFMLFDRADDSVIANRLRGAILKEYVYAFKQQGQMIYGLGVDGAEACKRELAKVGEVIREDAITIMYQDPERAFFQATASRWSVKRDQPELKLDTTVELKNQPKFITRRDGTQEPNAFWLEQGGSKAMRNAVLNLIPEWIKQQVIAMYKTQAKVVEMTPETSDAMTHEAHAAFTDKDTRAALVGRLKDRWRELGLQVAQVKRILVAKNLPEVLASPRADWSTVDPAVIQDMLTEAN